MLQQGSRRTIQCEQQTAKKMTIAATQQTQRNPENPVEDAKRENERPKQRVPPWKKNRSSPRASFPGSLEFLGIHCMSTNEVEAEKGMRPNN